MSRWCPDCWGEQPYVEGPRWVCIHCGAVWVRGPAPEEPATCRGSTQPLAACDERKLRAAQRLWASIEPSFRQALRLSP